MFYNIKCLVLFKWYLMFNVVLKFQLHLKMKNIQDLHLFIYFLKEIITLFPSL